MASRRTITVATAVVTIMAASFYAFDPWRAAASCVLGWTMLAIAATDAEDFIIPDALSLPSIPAGLIATHLLDGSNLQHELVLTHAAAAVAGMIALYVIKQAYLLYRNHEGLGLGDVKLVAAAGAWTGFEGLSHVLLLACVLAIAYVAMLNLRNPHAVNATTAVPFGVFLGPSIWVIWFTNGLIASSALGV